MHSFASSRLLVFVLLLTAAANGFSQPNTVSIKGTVTDQLGGLVVGATVAAKDSKGNAVSVTTNDDGVYQLHNLLPGRYDLIVTASGFATLEEKNVELKASKPLVRDLQLIVGSVEQVVTVDNKSVSTDSDRNADALVLGQKELEALPTDPDALAAALQAMAGPTSGNGDNGPQVKVDGFSNGTIPPKETIREVRINQNPYSAENEYPGWGGIEIFTQPGTDKFHGGGSFNFNDESLNSRNPFAKTRAPYQFRQWGGSLTGPIVKKRDSFTFYTNRYANFSNAIVNATILDPVTLKPSLFNQTIVTPGVSTNFGLRNDLKLNKKHTLVANYSYSRSSQDPQGLGGFSLPSRAYRTKNAYQQLQITETALINERTVNETRIQLTHSISRQTAQNNLPGLNVTDSFFGGGSQVGSASNLQERAEVQNFTSWTHKNHFVKIGGRLRYVRIKSISPSNFGGTYTFAGGPGQTLDANDNLVPGAPMIQLTSLERYRRTLVFQKQGLSPAQIRQLGGGATQLSIAGGNPEARVSQADVSFYIQEEWKVRPHFSLSPGLRYENQGNINSNFNFAPRIAFAWSPSFGHSKPAAPAADKKDAATAKGGTPPGKPAPPKQPKTVIRGGFGIFYSRIGENTVLLSRRFNGLNQQQFVVTDPAVLDLFPAVPAVATLNTFAVPQSRRILDPKMTPDQTFRATIGVEHQFSKTLQVNVSYAHSEDRHNLRVFNINAPLGGTFDPAVPTSGVRPFGLAAGNIFDYKTDGRERDDSLYVSANGKLAKKIDFWMNYSLNYSSGNTWGTTGSPFDAYDYSQEWGRSNYDTRHWMSGGASYSTKSGWSVNTFILANSGRPFNITTGRDTNGDTSFTERPAFALNPNKPGVIFTPYGALDPNPTPDEKIIPHNFAQGPRFFSVNIGASKTFKFGRAIAPKTPPSAAAGVGPTVSVAPVASSTPSTAAKPPAKPPVQRPYSFVFSIYVTNAFNHNNRSTPVGNMTSPFFLQSTSTSGMFFFGPGGGGSGGNRQITTRLGLRF
ncbi:MAG TPA: carboxypeptidase-like regulatory domain-containing protein [Pyrinomonadaceae bacterium]|nr:carboxypeptidase-like regulatory domain-containing protein [Pyrinomonadaceae bacterium]